MGSIATEPTTNPTPISLPVFNVSDTSAENAHRLVNAAIEYGFLYISPTGTPFTESLITNQFNLSKQLFSLPLPEKQAYHVSKTNTNRGYLGMHNEILDPTNNPKEFKEGFNIGEFINQTPQQDLPPLLLASLPQLTTFESACETTCTQILDLIGTGLHITNNDKTWFSTRHNQPSGSTVRLLHYPSLPASESYSPTTDIRAGAHSDYGSITLLFQRAHQPGLEIRPTPTDPWSAVPVFPPEYPSDTLPPILVNIGDLMSYWTNGLLRSTVHRVVFPRETKGEQSRYSLVYFCHPGDGEELVAVPSARVREEGERLRREGRFEEVMMGLGAGAGLEGGRALTAREHLLKRLEATYAHRKGKEGK